MLFTCEDREQHVIPASHDLTNVIYRGVAGKEKGGQGRAPSPYQLLLDKLVKSNLLCYTRTKLGFARANLMLTQVIQVRRLGSQAPSYLNYLCQH